MSTDSRTSTTQTSPNNGQTSHLQQAGEDAVRRKHARADALREVEDTILNRMELAREREQRGEGDTSGERLGMARILVEVLDMAGGRRGLAAPSFDTMTRLGRAHESTGSKNS